MAICSEKPFVGELGSSLDLPPENVARKSRQLSHLPLTFNPLLSILSSIYILSLPRSHVFPLYLILSLVILLLPLLSFSHFSSLSHIEVADKII